jgi:hypothetical protein
MADGYGKVSKPFWDDKPVAVIGGGPSFRDFDLERLRGAHVLAVKSVIIEVPWADACYGSGSYSDWRSKLENVQSRVYWAADQPEPSSKNITFLKRLDGEGVSDDPGEIYGGKTAGFGAMQICIHKRARTIVLFGFDYDQWPKWAEHFGVYASYFTQHGVNIVNASPRSKIRCFQKVGLDDGVRMLRIVKESAKA